MLPYRPITVIYGRGMEWLSVTCQLRIIFSVLKLIESRLLFDLYTFDYDKLVWTFMNLQTGGGNKSCKIRECVLISVATTSRLPSTSSPRVQISMEREAKSAHVGISASVNNTGLPKSRVTNRLAPTEKGHSAFTSKVTWSKEVCAPKQILQKNED